MTKLLLVNDFASANKAIMRSYAAALSFGDQIHGDFYGSKYAWIIDGYWLYHGEYERVGNNTTTGFMLGQFGDRNPTVEIRVDKLGRARGKIYEGSDRNFYLGHTGIITGVGPKSQARIFSAVEFADQGISIEEDNYGNNFVCLGDVSQAQTVRNLVSYAQCCASVRAGERYKATLLPEIEKTRFDGGARDPFTRTGADCDPRHYEVCDALSTHLLQQGFEVCPVSSKASIDLCYSRDGVRYIFEVKPSSDLHNSVVGVGQLLVYEKLEGASEKVLVSFGVPKIIKDLLQREFGIGHLMIKENERSYSFIDIDKILKIK